MSKSLGNFFTVREAAAAYGYDCIRMFMLMSHYRSPLNYSGEILMQAKAALEAKVKLLARQPRWKPTCDALKCLKGIDAVTAAHPRPDFKNQILKAFTDGFKHRPESTFGTVNADVLEHFVPGFRHIDFVEVIQNSAWPQ